MGTGTGAGAAAAHGTGAGTGAGTGTAQVVQPDGPRAHKSWTMARGRAYVFSRQGGAGAGLERLESQ